MGAAATTWESVWLAPPNTRIDEIDNGLDADEGVGIELYGGYRLSPYVAFELEFEMIPDVDVDLGGSGKIGELETWAITKHIVVSAGADYVLPAGSELQDLDYVSCGGGIQYRF